MGGGLINRTGDVFDEIGPMLYQKLGIFNEDSDSIGKRYGAD